MKALDVPSITELMTLARETDRQTAEREGAGGGGGECQEAPFDIIEARDIHQPNDLAAKVSV